MTSLADDLRRWDSFASHRTGTDGDDATGDWLLTEARASGADAHAHWFEFDRVEPALAELRVESQHITGLPLFDGGWTGSEGITGTLGEEVALLPFQPFDGHPQTRALHAARHRRDLAGIVAVANGDPIRSGLAVINAEDIRAPFGPPVLQVASQHRTMLEAAVQNRQSVSLTVTANHLSDRASNIQATVPGREPELAPVVVMTPRSGWFGCTAERGGGIAIWLNALRQLAATPARRTVLFWANSGHELAHLGLDAALAANPDLIGQAKCWVHLGANFAASDAEIRLQASSRDLANRLKTAFEQVRQPISAFTPIEDRPLGEARNIADGGGSYLSILGSTGYFHHPDDRWPDAVSLPALARCNEAMTTLIVNAANT